MSGGPRLPTASSRPARPASPCPPGLRPRLGKAASGDGDLLGWGDLFCLGLVAGSWNKFEETIIQTSNLILWKPYFLTSLSGLFVKTPISQDWSSKVGGGWRLSLGCPEERVGPGAFSLIPLSGAGWSLLIHTRGCQPQLPKQAQSISTPESSRPTPRPNPSWLGSSARSFLHGYRLLQARPCAAERLTSKPGSASLNAMLRNLDKTWDRTDLPACPPWRRDSCMVGG